MDGINQLLTGTPACVTNNADSWCAQVYRITNVSWLAESANWLVAKPLKILLITLLALLVRFLAHRLIDRLTTTGENAGKVPTLLRPLRERAPRTLGALSERRAQRAQTIGSVLKSVVSFAVLGIALIDILGELGINLGPILASAGIVGVAVAFGAQNLVKDFLSGMFMLLEDQYGVGDVVDVGPASGTVETVGLRITTLRDASGTVWYVRNGTIQRIGNSSQGHAVAVVDIPVAYGTNINQALDVIDRVAGKAVANEALVDDVLEAPQMLGVQSMTTEAVTLRLTVKVKPGKQWATQRELRRHVLTAFDEAGIAPPASTAS